MRTPPTPHLHFPRAIRVRPLVLAGTLALAGCGGAGPQAGPAPSGLASPDISGGHLVVADSFQGDPALEALIRPYRETMARSIEAVIGEAATDLDEGRPEGALGNFATDALLWAADSLLDAPVEIALMNNGGLRIPLARGPITVGTMFELMPFENLVSVLTLTGDQVVELAGVIARRGGEPVAGFGFHIADEGGERVAENISVGGEPVDPEGLYRLVTNDYLANGGDDMGVLLDAQARTDHPLLVRDAFMEYLKHIRVIRSQIEGRITGGRSP